jgi:prepilin signal peptidase PulO-like enzyme (type II secretory pathway)
MSPLLLFTVLITLLYAAYLDWQYRRVPKIVWIPLALIGLPVSIAEYWIGAEWESILTLGILAAVIYAAGVWKVIGGADAVCMVLLIAVLHEYGVITIFIACLCSLPFALYGYAKTRDLKEYGIPFMIPLLLGYLATVWLFLA